MIRAAVESDASAIADLWNWMIRDTFATFTDVPKTETEVATLLRARAGACLVHAVDGTCQGYAHFGPFRTGPGYAATCEHSVVVAPDAQGAGVGRALMPPLFELARAQGMHVMVAAISGANPGAVRFHQGLGFDHVGRMPQVGRKAGRWLDLVLMQKILSASD